MRRIIEADSELKRESAHHSYIYKDGKKTEILSSEEVYLYIDKYGLLHASKWRDTAEGRRSVATDEVSLFGGFPLLNGKVYKIWGAGEDYVYLDSRYSEKHYIPKKFSDSKADGNKAVFSGNGERDADYELLRQLYVMLIRPKEV